MCIHRKAQVFSTTVLILKMSNDRTYNCQDCDLYDIQENLKWDWIGFVHLQIGVLIKVPYLYSAFYYLTYNCLSPLATDNCLQNSVNIPHCK